MSNDYLSWLLDVVVLAPNLAYRINELTQAADVLARAAKDVKRLAPRQYKDDIILGNLYCALAAYEKVRGMK